MSERRLPAPVKEGGGGTLRGKAPEGYVLWPHKRSPGLEFVNYWQGWPWSGWEGVTGQNGAPVMEKKCLAEVQKGCPTLELGFLGRRGLDH